MYIFPFSREALLDGSIVSQSFTASPIFSKTSQSEIHRPISASLSQGGGSTNCSSIAPGKQDTQRSLSDNLSLYRDLAMTTSPTPSKKLVRSSTTESRESKEPARSKSESKGNSVVDPLDAVSSFSDHSVFDKEKSNMASLSTMQEDADREGASLILQVKHEPEEYNKLLSPRHDQVFPVCLPFNLFQIMNLTIGDYVGYAFLLLMLKRLKFFSFKDLP